MEEIKKFKRNYDIHSVSFVIENDEYLNNSYKSYHQYAEIELSIKTTGYYESPFTKINSKNFCRFYNSRLAYFLTSDYVHNATVLGAGNSFQEIRGYDYYQIYCENFKKGAEDFRQKFYIPPVKAYEPIYSPLINKIIEFETFWFNESHCNIEIIDAIHVANSGYYSGLYTSFLLMGDESGVFSQQDFKVLDLNWFQKELIYLKEKKNSFVRGISMKEIIDVLTPLYTHSVELKTQFLTEKEFILFIKRAFLGIEGIDKIDIADLTRKKAHFVKIFFLLYKKCKELGCIITKDKIADLILNNINGLSKEQILNNLR